MFPTRKLCKLTLFENVKTLHHQPLISVWKNQLSVLYLVQQRRFLHFLWWDFSPEPVACKINKLGISVIHEALTSSEKLVKKSQCITDLVEIWKCWFLRWGENWSTREKPLGAKEIRTNNKINPQMVSTQGFEHGPHWWEASDLTSVPFLAPQNKLVSINNTSCFWDWYKAENNF